MAEGNTGSAIYLPNDEPLGTHVAPAAICAAVFFVCAVANLYQGTFTKFKLARLLGISTLLRGIGFAIRASTIQKGYSSARLTSFYGFCIGGGFGLVIAQQNILMAGWLKNTAEWRRPRMAPFLRTLLLWVLFPVGIIFGPVLYLISSIIYSEGKGDNHLGTANEIRQISAAGLLGTAATGELLIMSLSLYALMTTGWELGWKRHPHMAIVPYTFGASMLLMSAAFRVSYAFHYTWVYYNEALFYPLQVLPEMLQALLLSFPSYCLHLHLSSSFNAWWSAWHSETGKMPVFGLHEPQSREADGEFMGVDKIEYKGGAAPPQTA